MALPGLPRLTKTRRRLRLPNLARPDRPSAGLDRRAGLGLLAGHTHINDTHYVAGRTKATDTPTTTNQGRPCSTVEQIGLGVDLGLPLIKTNVRTRCDLDSTTAVGQWITAGSWVLQALSWRAATLVVAGYTGVVRRT